MTNERYMNGKILLVIALLGISAFVDCVRADDASSRASSGLSYVMRIDPDNREVLMTGTVTGQPASAIKSFQSLGLRQKANVALRTRGGNATFEHRVSIGQSSFKDTFEPVLNEDYFAGFVGKLLIAPTIEGVVFKAISFTVVAPEGWNVASSRGIEAPTFTVASLKDLSGTLVCAGDYSTYSFSLKHQGDDAETDFYVAIRGQRDWSDNEFVDEFERLARGQMDFFGGAHPAPVQFLALHLLPRGENPSVPAFNRRVPSHDTVLALHTPARPRQHFEFLGMLAHEHLHNWYPNAMKSDLGPWFMEGLNDYVAYRGLLANGLHTREQFSGMLSKWHREYEYCVRVNDRRLMPYRRGMIAAWVFDIEIRRATDGKRGLTDVLLKLIAEKPDAGIVRRADILAMLEKVSGIEMASLYRHLVEADGAIDLATHLKGSGFHIVEATRRIEIRPETEEERSLFEAILSTGDAASLRHRRLRGFHSAHCPVSDFPAP